MNSEKIQNYIDQLKAPSFATEYPNLYCVNKPVLVPNKPIIFLVFGPSATGKDTIVEFTKQFEFVKFIKTATSRDPRPDEHDNYIWLPKREKNESEKKYIARVVASEKLIEYDFHSNNLYGVPQRSIDDALQSEFSVLIPNYIGVENLKAKLEYKANVVVLCVTTESWTDIEQRIFSIRENSNKRIEESIHSIMAARKLANYVLFNSFKKGGLEKSEHTIKFLVKDIYSKVWHPLTTKN
jgi:guanylate kinase